MLAAVRVSLRKVCVQGGGDPLLVLQPRVQDADVQPRGPGRLAQCRTGAVTTAALEATSSSPAPLPEGERERPWPGGAV